MNKIIVFSFALLFATAAQTVSAKNRVTFFSTIAGVLDNACEQVITFPEVIADECKDGYVAVKKATEPARTKIKEKSVAFGAAVKRTAKRTGTAIKDVVEPVGLKVKDAVAVTGDVLVDLGGQFVNAGKTVGVAVKNVTQKPRTVIKEAAVDTYEIFAEAGSELATFPADFAGECKDGYVAVKGAAVATKNGVKKVAKKTVVATKAFVNAFKEEVVV